MIIKVLGPGCKKCEKTVSLVQEALDESGKEAQIEKITDMMEIAGYGVMGTPAVVVDDEIKCAGKVPSKKEIITWLTA